jgi:hypothetical protein
VAGASEELLVARQSLEPPWVQTIGPKDEFLARFRLMCPIARGSVRVGVNAQHLDRIADVADVAATLGFLAKASLVPRPTLGRRAVARRRGNVAPPFAGWIRNKP